ncbi:hypothetical protein D3C81_1559350 [compost metagenome]
MSTLSTEAEACSNALRPNMARAIRALKPNTPPTMVNNVRRAPYRAPWVRASRLLGPGVSDRPMLASR